MADYKYDIAISFLAKDEHIAMEINSRLKERYNIFVYFEQQKNLAGKDGEGAFKSIFESESKLVVVLYRSEWGTTPWTRMEETGIRDRAYKENYDFVTFIALEEKPTMPTWFPKLRLYASYPRFGIDSAVAVIDARAQEAEILSREPTLEEQAQAFEKRRKFEAHRKQFLNSHQGGEAIKKMYAEVHSLIKERFTLMAHSLPSLKISDRSNAHQVGIVGDGPSLMVGYRQPYINSIEGSALQVGVYRGDPPLDGWQYFEKPLKTMELELTADCTEELPLCWHHKGRNYSNTETAELIVKFWLTQQPTGREKY